MHYWIIFEGPDGLPTHKEATDDEGAARLLSQLRHSRTRKGKAYGIYNTVTNEVNAYICTPKKATSYRLTMRNYIAANQTAVFE